MKVKELREFLEAYEDTDEVVVVTDEGIWYVEQEVDAGPGTFGMFAIR